mgnify:FL=1
MNLKNSTWKEVHVDGKKRDKCAGSGKESAWKKKKEREKARQVNHKVYKLIKFKKNVI